MTNPLFHVWIDWHGVRQRFSLAWWRCKHPTDQLRCCHDRDGERDDDLAYVWCRACRRYIVRPRLRVCSTTGEPHGDVPATMHVFEVSMMLRPEQASTVFEKMSDCDWVCSLVGEDGQCTLSAVSYTRAIEHHNEYGDYMGDIIESHTVHDDL